MELESWVHPCEGKSPQLGLVQGLQAETQESQRSSCLSQCGRHLWFLKRFFFSKPVADWTAEEQDRIPPLCPIETSPWEMQFLGSPRARLHTDGTAWQGTRTRAPYIHRGPWQGVRERQRGMQTAARWMQQAAKLVATSEQRGWASGRELPATCTAVFLRLLEKGPDPSPFWKNSKLEPIYSMQLSCLLPQWCKNLLSWSPVPMPALGSLSSPWIQGMASH